jgi:hypothetical protein
MRISGPDLQQELVDQWFVLQLLQYLLNLCDHESSRSTSYSTDFTCCFASPSESSMSASPEQPHRRASATSYKLITSGPASPSLAILSIEWTHSGALSSVAPDKPIEIHVLLPAGLLADYTSVDQLPVIYSTCTSIHHK